MDSMFTELENTPLAERARKAILDAILTGRFENDRLPSEDDLSKMLNVSPPRAGLGLLGHEGQFLFLGPTGLAVGLAQKESRYAEAASTIRPQNSGSPAPRLVARIQRKWRGPS